MATQLKLFRDKDTTPETDVITRQMQPRDWRSPETIERNKRAARLELLHRMRYR